MKVRSYPTLLEIWSVTIRSDYEHILARSRSGDYLPVQVKPQKLNYWAPVPGRSILLRCVWSSFFIYSFFPQLFSAQKMKPKASRSYLKFSLTCCCSTLCTMWAAPCRSKPRGLCLQRSLFWGKDGIVTGERKSLRFVLHVSDAPSCRWVLIVYVPVFVAENSLKFVLPRYTIHEYILWSIRENLGLRQGRVSATPPDTDCEYSYMVSSRAWCPRHDSAECCRPITALRDTASAIRGTEPIGATLTSIW